MKRIRKVTRKVHKTSFLSLGIGAAYEFWPNLQGVLPTWWYLIPFGVIAVLHFIEENRDGDE